MKKILVTGGAGYIGSHTIVELFNSGYTPVIIDNLCNSSLRNIKGISKILKTKIKWYNIDCCNQNLINNIFSKENNIKAVIHFAAYKSVEESIKHAKKYHENNIGSLNTILKAMKQHDINNIIFSSSCTVYGNPTSLPIKENSQFKKAESPYAETKQICENILENDNCNSISLRYFNPIGSHASSLIGDCSKDNATNLIPILSQVAAKEVEYVTVNGNDYNTPDGSCIRDYIHVEDVANAHVKSLNYLLKNPGKYSFNVGTGYGTSVLEAIKQFELANNIKIKYQIGKKRIGDIEEIYADCSLIMGKLNWKAKKNIKEAMIDAWNWKKKYYKG